MQSINGPSITIQQPVEPAAHEEPQYQMSAEEYYYWYYQQQQQQQPQ